MAVTSPVIARTTSITLPTAMGERGDHKVTRFDRCNSLTDFFHDPTATIYTDHYSSLPEKDWLRLLETGYDGRLYQVKAEETENLPDTFSIENAYFSSPESLLIFLEDLIRGQYGNIFRAKGQILAGSQWFQFDVADSRYGITGCEPQKTGKAVFIGTEIHRQPIRRVVLSKMIQKKIVVKKR